MVTYKEAGVDIEAGDALVERIRPLVASTSIPELLGDVGGFSGLVRLPEGMRDPVLVSGTDGVGTKLKVAQVAGRHDTVGIDLVAMAVNDVLTSGARPLFFLDYFACGRLDVDVAEKVISGVADGCRRAGCALVGGETAEMPGMYEPGEYDLAGFAVGVVERSRIIDGRNVRPGDVVVALPSSGLHSNGYSLARKVLWEDPGRSLDDVLAAGTGTLADVLLEPTRIYASEVAALQRTARLKAIAHITGGGIPGNLARVLPAGAAAVLDASSWEPPAVFAALADAGVAREEMVGTFNLGMGLAVIVDEADAHACLDALERLGTPGFLAGRITERGDEEPAVRL
ncbi:MAG: phosphoribosylformylglycinamidine cyclo-ligase [Deltaproteobacteria bacterium]|nr:phosphoribosylformylglycinamidine cyclo-ligase [Deltaproteobacteria bacterium]